MEVDLSRVQYAGFWERFFASVLDSIILLLVTLPLIYWIYGSDYFMGAGETAEVSGTWDLLINYLLPITATVLFWKYKSATPGKMMMGISVIDAKTGGVPPTGRLILRYLGYFVSTIPLLLGFIWVAFDKRKQGFHDKIADTFVIKNTLLDDSDDLEMESGDAG